MRRAAQLPVELQATRGYSQTLAVPNPDPAAGAGRRGLTAKWNAWLIANVALGGGLHLLFRLCRVLSLHLRTQHGRLR